MTIKGFAGGGSKPGLYQRTFLLPYDDDSLYFSWTLTLKRRVERMLQTKRAMHVDCFRVAVLSMTLLNERYSIILVHRSCMNTKLRLIYFSSWHVRAFLLSSFRQYTEINNYLKVWITRMFPNFHGWIKWKALALLHISIKNYATSYHSLAHKEVQCRVVLQRYDLESL